MIFSPLVTLGHSICPSGYLNVTFIRKTYTFASTEKFQLINPDTKQVVYESWSPSDNAYEMRYACIPQTSNSFYYLKMTNTNDECWTEGSWLEILGIYSNRVFKSGYQMWRSSISFLTPIHRNDEWYMTSHYSDDWQLTVSDDWETVSHLSSSGSSLVTYYRTVFHGMEALCAYEVQFYYKHGIVAYIDGIEIYRDNMGDGAVLISMKPVNEYENYDYRGVIRSGGEVAEEDHIIAVEIHRLHNDTIDFDCWLALYSSSLPDSSLCVYPVPVEDVTYEGESVPYVIDNSIETQLLIDSFIPGNSAFLFRIRPAQVVLWIYGTYNVTNAMSQMIVQGYKLYSDELTESVTVPVESRNREELLTTAGDNLSVYSDRFFVYPLQVTDIPFGISELRPYVYRCSLFLLPETLTFQSWYILTVNDKAKILPLMWSSYTCVSEPALPEGLSFDSCSIQGIPTIIQSNTTYHIYSYNYMGTRRHTIVITIVKKEVEEVKESGNKWWVVIIAAVVLLLAASVVFFLCHKDEKTTLPVVHLVPNVAPSILPDSAHSYLESSLSKAAESVSSLQPPQPTTISTPSDLLVSEHQLVTRPSLDSVSSQFLRPNPPTVSVLVQPINPESSVVSVLAKPTDQNL